MKKQKDRTQSEIPALTQSQRDSGSSTGSNGKTSRRSSNGSTSDDFSFSFSERIGRELLLEGHPCDAQVSGAFTRLLTNVKVAGDLLGFIDDAAWIRSRLVRGEPWSRNLSKGSSRRWVRGLMMAIEHAIPSNLIKHPSAEFNCVANYLNWLKRLPVCIRDEDVSIAEYIDCDRRIAHHSAKIDECVLLPRLRDIWSEWFSEFRITSDFMPHHGSGSTADAGRSRPQKWSKLAVDAVAHVCLRDARLEHIHGLEIGVPSRDSKIVFVPKQAGKDRAICMEPAWLQYLQQGVARQLIEYTHYGDSPVRKLVNIFSQEKNRELCAWAFTSGYSTIDLSNASDSVSWALIRELTRGMPLSRYLHATRSTHTIINGVRYPMSKFAPMGSALCFPIECFVFASIVELASRIHYGKSGTGFLQGFQVYGDDIICPAEVYNLVTELLVHFGFEVNQEKSCPGLDSPSGGYFESCGVEYLYGVRIHSVKHPRQHLFCQGDASPDLVGSVTDLANSLYDAGYFRARRTLLKQFEERDVRIGTRRRPFMSVMEFDPRHCVSVQSPYERPRWDSSIQRSVVDSWAVQTEVSRSTVDYTEAKLQMVRRTRDQRMAQLYHRLQKIDVLPEFSTKAVLSLSRFGFLDLLEGKDYEAGGVVRAGRLRDRFVLQTKPVVKDNRLASG